MKLHSYLLVGTKANRFISMIVRNNGFSLKYINRFVFILNVGVWASIFSFFEKMFYWRKIKYAKIEKDPIFIVGNWRTGSTYLFQLLALDHQFNFPTFIQASNPDHFLISRFFFAPVMKRFIGNKRPMDNVKVGVDEPQEDEYALLKISEGSILEDFIFPKKRSFFLDGLTDYSPNDKVHFISRFKKFLQKISINSNKQIVLKNPFHSLRIPLIKEEFPDSKYIHIYRDPEKVVPSTIHMWNIFGKQNLLKGVWHVPTVKQIAEIYKNIIITIRKEFSTLDKNQFIEKQYEELEQNPVTSIKNIYKQLNLEFTSSYERKLTEYSNELRSYKKNKFNVSSKDKNLIQEIMMSTLAEYYNK